MFSEKYSFSRLYTFFINGSSLCCFICYFYMLFFYVIYQQIHTSIVISSDLCSYILENVVMLQILNFLLKLVEACCYYCLHLHGFLLLILIRLPYSSPCYFYVCIIFIEISFKCLYNSSCQCCSTMLKF